MCAENARVAEETALSGRRARAVEESKREVERFAVFSLQSLVDEVCVSMLEERLVRFSDRHAKDGAFSSKVACGGPEFEFLTNWQSSRQQNAQDKILLDLTVV